MEVALVDTANLLAELAADDLARGRIQHGVLAQAFHRFQEREFQASIYGRTKLQGDLRLYVTDAQGRVVFDSEGRAVGMDYSRWNDVKRTLQGQYGARATRLDPSDERTSSMHVAAPIRQEGRLTGVLTVIAPTAIVQPYAERSARRIRNAGITLMGSALLLGLAFTWWLTRDLSRLRAYAKAVGTQQRVPLPALGSPELQELGVALEGMRTRLDGRDYVERYVHRLTHEMKSPLAAIRGAAELLQEVMPEADRSRFTANILDQEQRLRVLVERVLDLAKLQHQQGLLAPVQVSLGALLDQVIASRAVPSARKGVSLIREGLPEVACMGEPFLLEQAIGNLLDNALTFAPAGSTIRIRLEAGPSVEVEDEGPGLPAFASERIFTPFFSLPPPGSDAKGTGLGLCFVKEIAALHGGTASLTNARGGGALARITLKA